MHGLTRMRVCRHNITVCQQTSDRFWFCDLVKGGALFWTRLSVIMHRSRKFCQGGASQCSRPDYLLSCTDPENSVCVYVCVGSCFCCCFSVINIFQRGPYGPPREAVGSMGPTASRGRSAPEFLSKPKATCDFPGRVPPPCPPLWICP